MLDRLRSLLRRRAPDQSLGRSEPYRHASPTDLVDDGGAISGPAGSAPRDPSGSEPLSPGSQLGRAAQTGGVASEGARQDLPSDEEPGDRA